MTTVGLFPYIVFLFLAPMLVWLAVLTIQAWKDGD